MTKFLKYAVGIDVSKDSFHVCLSVIDTLQKVTIKASRSFSNQSKGFQELAHWVKNHRKEEDIPLVYLMEATGTHSQEFTTKI
jgi:transposase